MNIKELPPGFERTWLIKTSDNKFYDMYNDGKGKRYLYYNKRWRLILGSANLRMNFKEKAELIDEYAEKGYRFSKDFKKGYFIIFEDSNKDNKTTPIKEITKEIIPAAAEEETIIMEPKRKAA